MSKSLGQRRQVGFVENFRLLAARIRAMEVGRPPRASPATGPAPSTAQRLRTLLIMSAYPGDGRTTVVINLGIALAEGGSSVLLVDGDMRNSALAQRLDVTASRTVQQLLTDKRVLSRLDEEPIGLPTSIEHVQVLPAKRQEWGQPVPVLSPLIDLLPKEHAVDYIILDSPPCLRYADAFQLAPLVDGVFYIVRRRDQDWETQRDIRTQLDQAGANLLGVIFNRG